jgi:hypothetical protein
MDRLLRVNQGALQQSSLDDRDAFCCKAAYQNRNENGAMKNATGD